MKTQYETYRFRDKVAGLIAMADQIADEYTAQGYDLTLRQLYYQFVSRDLIPNTQQSYSRLGDAVNKGRLAGLIDWNHITDRTRNLKGHSHWSRPGDVINSAAASYRLDKWATQDVRVEVWVEKEALAGVIQRAAGAADVDWFSCRGYVSQSEMWAAAQRHYNYIMSDQRVVILHLGDHDPSGIDMTRDITDRLKAFVAKDWERETYGTEDWDEDWDVEDTLYQIQEEKGWDESPLTIERIALNMNQIRRYDPPPNPAKFTDSRAESYVARFGTSSWELDALEPSVLTALISTHIADVRDEGKYGMVIDQEDTERAHLRKMARHYDDLVTHLEGMD